MTATVVAAIKYDMAGKHLVLFWGLYQLSGIGPVFLRQQKGFVIDFGGFVEWRHLISLTTYSNNFLDAKVSNLVKEIISILELVFLRQAKTL